ncbi:MAG TPA: GNAT family N-acetyltransferase [Pyrinomonadaceae bacterium]|jgi:predicted GNAT superfamily acetyltransferase
MPIEVEIEIRECTTLDELAACVQLQRDVFALPDIEISPVRHLVVTKSAGGFVLGAFSAKVLVGFVLSVPAFLRGQKAFYSHMTAVRADYQGSGVGAKLKWAQRERSISEGVRLIKWTFEPVKARNAFFNLEKLGATVREYKENFYGVDYISAPQETEKVGLATDRLFAEWELESPKVNTLSAGDGFIETRRVAREVTVPADWYQLVSRNAKAARREQLRIRSEFESALTDGFICRGFRRDDRSPAYLFFED